MQEDYNNISLEYGCRDAYNKSIFGIVMVEWNTLLCYELLLGKFFTPHD